MRTAHRLAFRLLLAVALCAAAASASAQGDAKKICENIESRLAREPLRLGAFLAEQSCLGEAPADTTVVTKAVQQLIGDPAGTKPPANAVDEALRRVAEHVHDAALALDGDNLKLRPVLAALRLEIEAVRSRLRRQDPLRQQDVEGWKWQTDKFPGLRSLDLSPIAITCSQPCPVAVETGKVVFRAASLVRQTLQFRLTDVYEDALGAARVRDNKWTSYFDDARVQFPWELYVNGLAFRELNKKKGGFAETPNDQLILFHPGVGMEYVHGASAGSRFEPALIVELIGYNRWSWTKEGKVDTAWGASFIQTYSDRAGLSSMRHGVMLHYNSRYSLAFTRKNGETGILLSVDLAKLVTRVEQDERDLFRLGKSK